ncbi:MAG: c-type cytochrome [Bdellovibrionaceae bacterium]|nr:c-type cytochrome [Pseudobdellovibrionaceae bacterium]NUM58760.1 c-type cytochrome [Pseudobdellovibrionaceae bacterium]
MKNSFLSTTTLMLLFLTVAQLAPCQSQIIAEATSNLVITCAGCHGTEGISNNPLWPNLAGQKKEYLSKQLLAFKNQDRKDPLMNPIASSLNEKDIELIAEHFSKKKE